MKAKAGIYVRISRDEDKSYDSITIQLDALTRFANENKLDIVDIYEDNDVSGFLFNQRPEFNRMLEDLEANKLNTLIFKDLSRVGRNNARTLLFLEQMAESDIRVILVDDRYDSFNDEDKVKGDFLPINSFVNEIYVKDISRKVRFSLKEKQLQGTLLIRATFGYKKVGNKLVVDDVASLIVKKIFQLYRDGYGYRKITNILNEGDYPTPSEIDNTGRPVTKLWNSTHVNRILKNEIYTGVFETRKTIRKGIKSKKFDKLPKEEWIRIEDNHEAIISKEEFNAVQKIISKRKNSNIRAGKGKINLFAGLVFCHDCGSPMFCVKSPKFATYYQCGNYYKYGVSACSSHRVMEKNLIVTILYNLKDVAIKIAEVLSSFDKTLEAEANMQKSFSESIDKLRKEIDNKKKEKMVIYKDKVKGLIDEEMYLELTKEIDSILRIKEEQLDEFEKLELKSKKTKKILMTHLDILESLTKEDLENKETLEKFVDRIEINRDKEIELLEWNNVIASMYQ